MEIEIFDYGMNGEGVGKINGKIALISDALVGEVVEAEIVKENKNFCVANVKSVIKKSQQRQIPPCPYFFDCGGCDLQHMKYEEQLKFKQMLVQKTIKKITGVDYQVSNTVPSENVFNYRNKLSINFKDGKSGFFKEGSKDIVEIKNCMLASEKINKIYEIFAKNIKNNAKFVKNLVIREINNQILVGVVVNKAFDLLPIYEIINKEIVNVGMFQILNTRKDSVVLSGKVSHIAGIKEINIENFGLNYSVDLLGFHQTNEDIQNKIYEKVLEFISPNSVVLNGFSGQGLLSAIIAKKAHQVYGIEINESSHKSAENLKIVNKVNNLTNICGDFYKKFDKIKKNINTIVLDPSKKGCGRDTMCAIIGVENIIYISCNPIALAKDLRELLPFYEIQDVVPFDMFPNTKSVETLVKLKLKEKKWF